MQVVAVAHKDVVRLLVDLDVQVASRPAARPDLALGAHVAPYPAERVLVLDGNDFANFSAARSLNTSLSAPRTISVGQEIFVTSRLSRSRCAVLMRDASSEARR